jgi:hypothetical protein
MFYFRVTFQDGSHIFESNLTKRQAVIRYNKWVREMAMQPIQEVTWGLL